MWQLKRRDNLIQELEFTANKLGCIRNDRVIFSDISFHLRSGQALVVTGRNGSGKSSLLAVLAGRLPPSEGHFILNGICGRTKTESMQSIGHRNALKSSLSLLENLSFAQSVLGYPALTPLQALKFFNLAQIGHLPVSDLSAGQQRQVALARLLVSHRPLWLLDEPTSALDQKACDIFYQMLADHLKKKGLAVISTHQTLSLEHAILLNLGSGSSKQIRNDVQKGVS